MKSILRMSLFLLLVALPGLVSANWSDPTVILPTQRVKLGSTISVNYYNAPAGASIAVYPQTGSVSDAVVKKSVTEGKGSATLTIPASAAPHGYNVALVSGTAALGEPALLLADAVGEGFTISTDKESYARGGTVNITYTNAPACSGDRIVMYPVSYTVVPATSVNYTAPTYTADVTGTTGTASFRVTESGYYMLYYFLDGTFNTVLDTKFVMVGTPASLSIEKTKYSPEENIVITFSGLSKKMPDWIGVFGTDSTLATDGYEYRVDCLGRATGKIEIPAGTLPEGRYKVSSFFSDSRVYTSTLTRFTIAASTSSLQCVTDTSETYYTISSAVDSKAFADDATSASASKQNIKLAALDKSQAAQQWKLVKRDNGKIDIINRVSGNYLLTNSTMSGNFNLTKMGQTDTDNHGWTIALISGDQYGISGIEEDGVTRYLYNATVGVDPEPLNLSAGSNFAWVLTPVETVVTGIQGAHLGKSGISVEDGKIKVTGTKDFVIYNADGKAMNKNTRLPAGIYVVKYQGGVSAKVSVK